MQKLIKRLEALEQKARDSGDIERADRLEDEIRQLIRTNAGTSIFEPKKPKGKKTRA